MAEVAEILEKRQGDNPSLEKLLRNVDYSKYEKDYIPSQFALKFVNFIKLIYGDSGIENKTPLFHYEILDTIHEHSNVLIVAARGTAKTTIIEHLFLYIATFGHLDGFGDVKVAMYVADTHDNGCKNMRNNLEHRYQGSDFLKKFVPKVKFTDMEVEFTNADGHEFTVRMFGANTGVRGFRKYGERPSLVAIDDIFTDKSAESKTILKDIENIIYKSIRQALHPTRRKTIWIGTPFSQKDLLYQAAGTRSWTTRVYPICEQFPCAKNDFRGAWEDRFPYSAVRAEYEMLKDNGRIDAFNQELMLRILSDEDRFILDEDIVWYRRSDVLENLGHYNIYFTTDFATSETQKSDFSVIAVWALDHKGRFHWVDGVVARQDMAKNVDDVFRLVQLYHPLLVGVEISGQQRGFVSWLQRDMLTRGIWFTLGSDKATGEAGLRPTTNKLTRFSAAIPLFKQRKMAFPEELQESPIIMEYIDELTSVTPGGIKSLHDDCIDSISQLQLMDYFPPADPTVKVVETQTFRDSKYFRIPEPIKEQNSYIV